MSSGCNARVGAHFKSNALQGRVFLEQEADGVNDFLVQAGGAVDDHLILRSSVRQHGARM
jgi:hypothetical protein